MFRSANLVLSKNQSYILQIKLFGRSLSVTKLNEQKEKLDNGDQISTYPGCVNMSFAYVEGESLLMACKDIALSSGR